MGINLRKGSFPSHKDSFPYDSSPSIYFFFHLAENEMLSSGTVREISIVLNDIYSIVPSVILQYLVPRTICTTSVGILVNLNEENYLQIFGASCSKLPPIINGFEVFYFANLSCSLTLS
uniref:Malectin-like domain-containing protein n=1 Tax=Cucumis melo TaxID=3656 RepID=A0A9I9DH46_CUCME